MESFDSAILIILVIAFWAIPIVLGVRIAKKKNISPHWFWFGIHPFFGWIAFGIIYAHKGRKTCPKCLEVLKKHAKVCAYCNHPFDDIENHKPIEEIARDKKKNRTRNILIGVGVFLVTMIFMMAILTTMFTNSWAYKNALIIAKSNLELKSKLGSPIEKNSYFIGGSIVTNGGKGNADLTIPIKGSRGKGTLMVFANKSQGTWSMDTLLFIDTNNKDTITLLNEIAQ
jgi:hypothetical protein